MGRRDLHDDPNAREQKRRGRCTGDSFRRKAITRPPSRRVTAFNEAAATSVLRETPALVRSERRQQSAVRSCSDRRCGFRLRLRPVPSTSSPACDAYVRDVGGRALIDGCRVAVAVDDPPLAVLAAAEFWKIPRAARQAMTDVLEIIR